MIARSTRRATLDDLYREEGKAELIDGEIVRLMAAGYLPSLVAFVIAISLRAYARFCGIGFVLPDGIGYAVPALRSGRESFSPDASYYDGALPANTMSFLRGAPALAVEVRSENDYGPAAEIEMAAKRTDYFEAGTQVVWDVDPVAETVTVYRASDPTHSVIYHRGEVAEAEPAVPGWRMAVDEIFAG